MISLDNAYKNIVKDEGWLTNYFVFLLIFIIAFIVPGLFSVSNSTQPQNVSAQQLLSQLGIFSITMLFSIVGSVVFCGYNAIYLRNMMADKNAPIFNIKSFFTDILGAGLKLYAATIIYILSLYLGVTVIGISFVILSLGNMKVFLPIAILLLLILALGLCMLFPLIMINYSANNCKFTSLFDFKNAIRYLTKNYWIVILLCVVFTVTIYIIMGILMGILFLAGIKVSNYNFAPLMVYTSLIISPISVFWTLIYNNLLAQIYYSKVEEK